MITLNLPMRRGEVWGAAKKVTGGNKIVQPPTSNMLLRHKTEERKDELGVYTVGASK